MKHYIEKLRDVSEFLAPDLSIHVGNKVYLFISASSPRHGAEYSPRESSFTRQGKVLVSLEWLLNDDAKDLIVSFKMPIDGRDIMLEENTMFPDLVWKDEEEKTIILNDVRDEILNWSNKITMGFVA